MSGGNESRDNQRGGESYGVGMTQRGMIMIVTMGCCGGITLGFMSLGTESHVLYEVLN